MNSRTTLVLLVVSVALGLYLYFVPAADEDLTPPSETQIPVLTFESRQVARMEVQNASGERLEVMRNNDEWDVVTDQRVAGDTILIGPMVANVAGLQATTVITPEAQSMADYGLQTPALTVNLYSLDAPLATLLVGTRNPSGGARYVQVQGRPQVYLVSDSTLDTIEGWYTAVPIAPTPLPTLIPTTAP